MDFTECFLTFGPTSPGPGWLLPSHYDLVRLESPVRRVVALSQIVPMVHHVALHIYHLMDMENGFHRVLFDIWPHCPGPGPGPRTTSTTHARAGLNGFH